MTQYISTAFLAVHVFLSNHLFGLFAHSQLSPIFRSIIPVTSPKEPRYKSNSLNMKNPRNKEGSPMAISIPPPIINAMDCGLFILFFHISGIVFYLPRVNNLLVYLVWYRSCYSSGTKVSGVMITVLNVQPRYSSFTA